MTSRGLSVSLPLRKYHIPQHDVTLAYIGCCFRGRAICIPLKILKSHARGSNIFACLSSGDIRFVFLNPKEVESFTTTSIYIEQGNSSYLAKPKFDLQIYYEVNTEELHGCSIWKKCRGLRRLDFTVHNLQYAEIITDNAEAFIVWLGQDRASISQGIKLDDNRVETDAIIEHSVKSGVFTAEQIDQLSLQHKAQDQTTKYLTDCAITVTYKRTKDGTRIDISSWSTLGTYVIEK
ncbi:hypothetical protein BKA65DRAFT_53360 [Rhexocercosporidium sp. MPI-PUGE-AT-0058]|nr:hypothetical protein BKA65DRAFT_53360 [Rhexocercosporidium sp. MPI-PUGE-AT-0058]